MTKYSDELKKDYYNPNVIFENANLDRTFEKVFDIFIENNYSNNSTLFCTIHESFKKGHNCIGCNLDSNNTRIENFLIQFRNFNDVNLTFTTFLLLLYLQVESISEYFNIIEIQEKYKEKHFKVFTDIKRWANFLKHPKAFMLIHHPNWTYKDRIFKDEYYKKFYQETEPTINSVFINKYYSGDKNNKELYKILSKKENLLVMFPNPIELIENFTLAQKKFVQLISDNSIARELLEDETTIEKHFQED